MSSISYSMKWVNTVHGGLNRECDDSKHGSTAAVSFQAPEMFCAASLFRKYTTCLIQIHLPYTSLGGLKGARCNFYLTEISLLRLATSALGVSVDLGREALRRMNS